MDGEMRAKLGDAGCRKAQQREMQLLKGMWIDAANEVVRAPTIRGLRTSVINSLNKEGFA
jgi:hypothetical protein